MIKVSDQIELEQVTDTRKEEFLALCERINQQGMERKPDLVDKCRSLEASQLLLADYYDKFQETGAPDFFILYEGKIAGTIGYHPFDIGDKIGEVGFWIAPMFQRKGIASKSVISVLEYGLEEIELNRVELLIEPDNLPSIGLAEKCGLTKDEDKYEDGERYICFFSSRG